MQGIFAPEYQLLWSVALAVVLFFPVRQLIWVMAVRRAQRRAGGQLPDDKLRHYLKGRAGVTSALLCFAFSAVYSGIMLGGER